MRLRQNSVKPRPNLMTATTRLLLIGNLFLQQAMYEPNTSTSTTASSSVTSAIKRKFAFRQPSAVSEDSGDLETIIVHYELLSSLSRTLCGNRLQFTDHLAR